MNNTFRIARYSAASILWLRESSPFLSSQPRYVAAQRAAQVRKPLVRVGDRIGRVIARAYAETI